MGAVDLPANNLHSTVTFQGLPRPEPAGRPRTRLLGLLQPSEDGGVGPEAGLFRPTQDACG